MTCAKALIRRWLSPIYPSGKTGGKSGPYKRKSKLSEAERNYLFTKFPAYPPFNKELVQNFNSTAKEFGGEMLLIALAILWVGAGVYWLRNRITAPSLALSNTTSRFRMRRSAKAVVVPLHNSQQFLGAGLQPGHSLVEPPLDSRQKG